jgi:hypothetical protein
LFYGGRAPTWSNRTLHEILRRHGANRRRIGFIDYHTGLGPPGYGEPIFMSSPDHPGLARARQWYGADVTSPAAGTSTSAPLQGTIDGAFAQAAPKAELTAIALEYGTLPLLEVKTALRGDHWLHNRGDLRSALGREIKARMRAAFYIETDEWRDKVLARALDLTRKAIAALAA